jgi:hypothetical protein
MIHGSYFKPRIFPILGSGGGAEIDRAQGIDPTITLNREKVNELGRDGAVCYIKRSPTVGYRATQFENGSIEFWQKLVNDEVKGSAGQDAIDIDDFKTSYFDICAYLTDDDGTFVGTMHYPALRTSGFSLSISDPQAIIERSFDFVGEFAHIWQNDNKYLIVHEKTGSSTITFGSGADFTQIPVKDPDTTDTYILRVVLYNASSGTATVLTRGTDWSYSDGSKTLTISVSVGGSDIVKIWYTSSDAPDTQFTLNDSDECALTGESADIFLCIGTPGGSEDAVVRLQSATIDVAFDREDHREIGNKDVVQRGIRSKTVTVTLGRLMEDFTIEEILRDKLGADYGKIDVEEFSSDITLVVKIYEDNTKSTLKYGFMCENLSPTEIRGGATVEEYVTGENVLEGEEMVISADNTKIGNIS